MSSTSKSRSLNYVCLSLRIRVSSEVLPSYGARSECSLEDREESEPRSTLEC